MGDGGAMTVQCARRVCCSLIRMFVMIHIGVYAALQVVISARGLSM
jgi:hypothetical protein